MFTFCFGVNDLSAARYSAQNNAMHKRALMNVCQPMFAVRASKEIFDDCLWYNATKRT